jgi:universal stress protein E
MTIKVVCATDLLSKSDGAVVRAGLLAERLGANLTLLHVVGPHNAAAVLEERLRTAQVSMTSRMHASRWGRGYTPAVSILPGVPARLILETLEQSRSALLILGPHRPRPVRDILEGTIAEKALSSKACPVLIVRDLPQASYRRVLLALDASEASATAARAASSLVLTPDVEAAVVHVCEPAYAGPGYHAETLQRRAMRVIRNMLERERVSFPYEISVARGDPAAAILGAIKQYQPDLLVMGTRGLGRLRRAFLGSVANRVLQGVSCDALIVPEGSFVGLRRKGLIGGRRSGRWVNDEKLVG